MQEPALRAILGRLGIRPTEKTGTGWLHAPCPFASDRHRNGRDVRPSFGAKIEDRGVSSYHCYSCKMHGRISSLVRALHMYGHDVGEMDGHGFPALAREADIADMGVMGDVPFDGAQEPRRLPEPLDEDAYAGLFGSAYDDEEAGRYLEGRGVGYRTVQQLGLGWDPDQRRIVFPVRGGDGALYGFTGRSIVPGAQPKIRDYHGLPKRHLIMGHHRWRGDRPIVIVEGLFAYAHLIEMDLERYADVGALLGSAMTEEKAAILRDQYPSPVFLFLDNDEAGTVALFGPQDRQGNQDFQAGAIAALLGHVPVHVPAWPDGKEDPDQLSKAEVWAMLQAEAYPVRG